MLQALSLQAAKGTHPLSVQAVVIIVIRYGAYDVNLYYSANLTQF